MNSNSDEDNHKVYFQEDKDEYSTDLELKRRFEHLRRVTRKQSNPKMREHSSSIPIFSEQYHEFSDTFTQDELFGLEKCFLMADHDRDGFLNDVELKYWMEKHNRPITQRHVRLILREADLDGDGALSFREFLIFCKKIGLKDSSQQRIETFCDIFGEDITSIQQFRRFVKQDGSYTQLGPEARNNIQYFEERMARELQRSHSLSEEKYEDRIREIKQIPSEYLNLEEFCKDLQHPTEEFKDICNEFEIVTIFKDVKVKAVNKGVKAFTALRTAIKITAQRHDQWSPQLQDGEAEEDAKIIVPYDSESEHNFDNYYIDESTGEEIHEPRKSISDSDKQTSGNSEKTQANYKRTNEQVETTQHHHHHKVVDPSLEEDYETLEII